MEPRNPQHSAAVRALFTDAPFTEDLGLRHHDDGLGWCETELALKRRHLQQTGTVHAGVLATVADHTAGGAGTSLVAADEHVLSAEFKINMLRPAVGQRLRCRAEVLKAGRRLSVVEAWVHAHGGAGNEPVLVAKATVTLAVIRAPG